MPFPHLDGLVGSGYSYSFVIDRAVDLSLIQGDGIHKQQQQHLGTNVTHSLAFIFTHMRLEIV